MDSTSCCLTLVVWLKCIHHSGWKHCSLVEVWWCWLRFHGTCRASLWQIIESYCTSDHPFAVRLHLSGIFFNKIMPGGQNCPGTLSRTKQWNQVMPWPVHSLDFNPELLVLRTRYQLVWISLGLHACTVVLTTLWVHAPINWDCSEVGLGGEGRPYWKSVTHTPC